MIEFSVIIGIIVMVLMYFIFITKINNFKSVLMSYCVGVCVGLLIFLPMYQVNDHNTNYLSSYLDYTKIETIKSDTIIYSWYDENDPVTYYNEYLLSYKNGEKILCFFSYEEPRSFEEIDFHFTLTDGSSKTVYSVCFSEDREFLNELIDEFVN